MPTLREFEGWLSTTETAERLGKSRQGILYMAKHRKIRSVETHIGWLHDPQSVEELAEKQQTSRVKAGV